MKNFLFLLTLMAIGALCPSPAVAGNCDPDSLEEVTISGTVDVVVMGNTELYFLMTDSVMYRLNFGPWWYSPSVGEATRPEDGTVVEIYGGLNSTDHGLIADVIIVYEIDGEFWRNPYDPIWNNFNNNFSSDPASFGSGTACGWPDSSLNIESYYGVVMIDSTLNDFNYFLDIDFDQIPDYRLNFGPPWYEPVDDLRLPGLGDTVNIDGAILHTSYYPVVIVFTLNGEVWRDDTGFGPSTFGKWMHGSQNSASTISSPFDSLTQIKFRHGWHQGGMPGSMYCQLLEIYHQNMFAHGDYRAFAGFEIGLLNQERQNMMFDDQYRHGMRVHNNVRLQLHYTDTQLVRANIQANERIRLFHWCQIDSVWVEEMGITVDQELQLVVLETDTLRSFYIITGSEGTSAIFNEPAIKEDAIVIKPNPVLTQTAIEIELEQSGHTRLGLYSMSGQLLRLLLNARMSEGIYTVDVDTADLPGGVYSVLLTTDSYRSSKLLIVVK